MARPKSVTVVSIINMIISVLGVCGIGAAIVMRFIPLDAFNQNNPTYEMMENDEVYKLFVDVSVAVGAVATIALIASAIGLLFLKEWARITTICYGFYSIVTSIFGSIISYMWVTPRMLAQVSGPERTGMIIGLVVGAIFTVIFIIYYILMIVLLMRSRVVAAFKKDDDLWINQNEEQYAPGNGG